MSQGLVYAKLVEAHESGRLRAQRGGRRSRRARNRIISRRLG
jgi:hypothetical protein